MTSKKSISKGIVFGVVAIATIGVAQVIAGGMGGSADCCFSFTEGSQTATSCLGYACASNEVCSGTGGVLANGQPWALADCVPKPPTHIGPGVGIN